MANARQCAVYNMKCVVCRVLKSIIGDCLLYLCFVTCPASLAGGVDITCFWVVSILTDVLCH